MSDTRGLISYVYDDSLFTIWALYDKGVAYSSGECNHVLIRKGGKWYPVHFNTLSDLTLEIVRSAISARSVSNLIIGDKLEKLYVSWVRKMVDDELHNA